MHLPRKARKKQKERQKAKSTGTDQRKKSLLQPCHATMSGDRGPPSARPALAHVILYYNLPGFRRPYLLLPERRWAADGCRLPRPCLSLRANRLGMRDGMVGPGQEIARTE